jgi:DNA-binding SARP family transcriptional activator/TolB-like protein
MIVESSRRTIRPLGIPLPNGIVMLRLRLIGQMEAWTAGGESVLPVGRKTRALLAALALSSPRPMLRTRLAELLWSRRPEEQARASLRQEIHRLLSALGPQAGDAIAVNRDYLALRPGTAWVDVEEVLRATIAKPTGLSLLDGDLLEDLNGVDAAFDGWLTVERDRLRDKARGLGETLLRDQREPEGIVAAARQLLAIDGTHEGAWRALMRAHTGNGEHGMAIQAFDRCRIVLADRLGAAPSEETQRLASDLRAAAGQAATPIARTPPRPEPRPPTPRADSAQPPAAALRGGVRVGVLPLQVIAATEAEAHLGVSLAEEITAELSRFRWLSLVSSSALARHAAQSRDEGSIRRAFDMQFLLDGSIQRVPGQRVPGRLRISLRLLDLRAGNQVVWSRRIDRTADDLLALQDEIASEVAAQIDAELLLIEGQRVAARPMGDASAYDLMLRAMPLIHRLERPTFQQAGDYLLRAVTQECDFAAAHAWYAYWHIFLIGQGWARNPTFKMSEATRLADRAVLLDPQDAKALSIAGHVDAFVHLRLREGIALHDRALSHNPNLAMAWSLSGLAHAHAGDLPEAERRLQRYKTLSPMDPHAFFYDTGLIVVALLKREHAAAVRIGRAVSALKPGFSAPCKPYLAALGHLGFTDEADALRARLLDLEPGFSIAGFLATTPLADPEHRAHYAEGLRRAGVAA